MGRFADAISNDYQVLDEPETVTFTPVNHSGGDPVEVEGAQRYAIGLVEIEQSQGLFVAGDVVWELPLVLMEDVQPQQGDTVTDSDDVAWVVVQRVGKIIWGTAWQLVCRPQR